MNLVLRHYIIRLTYIAIDTFFICLSIYLACMLRHTTIPFDISIQNIFLSSTNNPDQFIFIFWVIITILFLYSRNLYQTRRELLEALEIVDLVKAIVFATLVVIVAIYGLKAEGFPRTILALGTIFNVAFLSIWRIIKRNFVEYIVANGYNNFNVIIVGAGKVGTALWHEIKRRPSLGLKVVGYLDDFKTEPLEKKGPKVLGKVSEFVKISRNEFVNKVIITTHLEGEAFIRLLEQAKKVNVAVSVVPHGFELMSSEAHKFNIGLIPIIEYSDEERVIKQAGKRLFDLVFGLIAFICALPLFLAIAIYVKRDSSGPLFYSSRRYGRAGRSFKMYKFRSMAHDAENKMDELRADNEVDGPIFKMKKDPRVTKAGRFIRKYSLDELPQLLNVIKGDMSLVGPRPLPIEQIEKEDLRQLKRLEVRPGITGLWQIRGRSDISFSRLVKWDVWYINNWSFWLDVNILLQTIPVVIKAKGAY